MTAQIAKRVAQSEVGRRVPRLEAAAPPEELLFVLVSIPTLGRPVEEIPVHRVLFSEELPRFNRNPNGSRTTQPKQRSVEATGALDRCFVLVARRPFGEIVDTKADDTADGSIQEKA